MNDPVQEIRRTGAAVVVALAGDVTIEQSPRLHRSLIELCDEPVQHLVVDFAAVPYIDSSGVGTLVDIYRRLKRTDGRMSLVALQPHVRSVFEITRLDRFFSIYSTEQEALQP